MLAQVNLEEHPDIPSEVDNYHNLVPLEPPPSNPMEKSNTFGYTTSVYKATHMKTGLIYCLRRIHGGWIRLYGIDNDSEHTAREKMTGFCFF